MLNPQSDNALDSLAPVPEGWPSAMSDAAFHGPVGALVRLIEPNTEADCHGILLDSLISFGNAVGRGAYFGVEADRHHANLFGVFVGDSAKARKGTSLGHTDAVRGLSHCLPRIHRTNWRGD